MALNPMVSLAGLSARDREDLLSGMRKPRPQLLRRDESIVRFSSQRLPSAGWAAGPWWLGLGSYREIVEEYLHSRALHGRLGLTLGYLARGAAAVLHDWSDMDVMVRAVLRDDVWAFTGAGQKQREESPGGIHVEWSGWASATQIYIPGLSIKIGRVPHLTPLGSAALDIRRQKRVPSQRLW